MSQISPSVLSENPSKAFQERLSSAKNAEEIKSICHDEELRTGKITLDWDQSYRIPVETPEPTSFTKALTIGTLTYNLQSDSAEGLANAEIALYRQVFKPAAATVEPVRDPATGQFSATADQDRSAVDDSTQQIESSIVTRALEQVGIDPAALQEVTQQRYQNSWARATEDFLHGPGSEWPGGEANRRKLGEQIIAMGLDGSPSVESLTKAFDHLKKNNELVTNPELERNARIAQAHTPQELRDAVGYRGDMWGK